MSVPLWWNEAGLPVGVHFLGRFGDEATLIRLASQLEAAQPWASRLPDVHAASPRSANSRVTSRTLPETDDASVAPGAIGVYLLMDRDGHVISTAPFTLAYARNQLSGPRE